MPDAMAAAGLKRWFEDKENFDAIKAAFETTTSFGEGAEKEREGEREGGGAFAFMTSR